MVESVGLFCSLIRLNLGALLGDPGEKRVLILPLVLTMKDSLSFLYLDLHWLFSVRLGNDSLEFSSFRRSGVCPAPWVIHVFNLSIPHQWTRTGLHTNGSVLREYYSLCKSKMALGCCWSEEFKPIHLQWHRTVLWVVGCKDSFIHLLFYHMIIHFDEVKKIFPLGFYSLLMVPPVLAMMNAFWFWKIAKGLIKTLSKARHSQ
ncbi:hypothetical protein CK203_072595 [Vitis vinifera]|uniref:TLC domain-containing protein n=1 Tax=Vitis vinifera TaxID=29760 RepID=A0A438F8W1_VITVI|nr:hypothetical protein CK203_072595 [Vitis vinifera]